MKKSFGKIIILTLALIRLIRKFLENVSMHQEFWHKKNINKQLGNLAPAQHAPVSLKQASSNFDQQLMPTFCSVCTV